jgi:hypothetical protein
MKRPRFTIASILLTVLCVAVGVAALRASDDMWDGAIFGIAALSFLTAVLMAVHRTERRRAFWLGFALFGCIYLGASLIPIINNRLPTSKALVFLDSKLPRAGSGLSILDLDGDGSLDLIVSTGTQASGFYLNQSDGTLRAVNGSAAPGANGAVLSRLDTTWSSGSRLLLSAPRGTRENFVRIGHSLLAMIIAILGGSLSRSIQARERSRSIESTGSNPENTPNPDAEPRP